jgi:thioredoxin-related protein
LKRLFLIAVLAVIVVPQASAGPWLKSLAVAQKKAKDGNQLIFVDLFADWCGWCHRMEQEVFPSQTFQNATDDKVLLRLNTEDGADGTKLARQYNVTSLPTFLLITGDGTMAGLIRGYAPPKEFVQSMKDAEGRYTTFVENVKKEPTFGKDYRKRLDLAIEFGQRQNYAASEARMKRLIEESKAPADIRDETYFNLALTQSLSGKHDEALKTIAAFSKVQNKGATFERARFLAGQIYYEQGNLMAAATELRKFKSAFPKSTFVANVDFLLPQIEAQMRKHP